MQRQVSRSVFTYLRGVVWLLLLPLLACVAAVGHTYLIYPRRLLRFGSGEGAAERGCTVNREPSTWPDVHLLMAVHNEEAILERKLATISAQDYPGRLVLHIGSDRSTDTTNAILRRFASASRFSVTLHLNADRRGKPATVNLLARDLPRKSILVLTDASVLLRPDTVTELIRPLALTPELGLTDSRMVHTLVRRDGIAAVEDGYIRGEVALKAAESERYGRFIGPFGGCWAIRAAAFRPVPATFLVDDFYLCMAAYRDGWRGRTVPTATVHEDVGQTIRGEFRRKVRIGAGNWQNLVAFRELWWPPWRSDLAYAFFSHKVLRWCTPLFLITGAGCWFLLVLLSGNYWLGLLFVGLIGAWTVAIVGERLLSVFGIHCTRVRALTYFTVMNLALLLGMLRYLNGISTNVWQPSDRPRADGPRHDPE